ncbi:putative RNA polymerase II holoenzyme/mediator complex component Rgr1 [Talaromyces proteolyticus]|uniref:Mediator of RNA polymerase II transcription subunit 14 n=1 Tax=Talaromyces proteolyticus TaxID=1131652 RepID=A0AAD4Q349_9EURO|nr:putative RNA polymerase II holoenzyme/mediator complex component Rgr1 [Talaromyces proteolyticus]KAH8704724.1 putative RNA polymerase II holoenzyme/mediator complex component Rgr1 [Talaromyces proteolyticus]
MPGLVMDDASASGSRQWANSHDSHGRDRATDLSHKQNGETGTSGKALQYGNGPKESESFNSLTIQKQEKHTAVIPDITQWQNPPELLHITHGFFPFAQLVNRAVQQCWNELSELVTELAEINVASQPSQAALANGKALGNQTTENVQKKVRLLEFAQSKRTEFIKLLVLSQWSRQAEDVSKLIELQSFIRVRHMAYQAAIQRVADMKRDLVRAQVANPDLETALEILTTGRIANMSDLGYKPPKPLSARRLLKTLQKINRIISTRLVTFDSIPVSMNNYHVHDGRVTFFVHKEFEIDLSIAEEDPLSQFYFIDIRFLFTPSSPIPKGRFFNELDVRINNILKSHGLAGCFDFVHNLVLVNKISILFKQAIDLSRGQWAGALRVELLHRILVVQYWPDKVGSKSWVEIGVQSGRQQHRQIPYIGLRWIREGKVVDSSDVVFDMETLSMESILRSVIAIHTSHSLLSAYDRIRSETLFANRQLSIKVQMSTVEPGSCCLHVQLTPSRHLDASLEPVSGSISIHTKPSLLSRLEKGVAAEDDLAARISRLRCIAAMEEIESNAKVIGWEIIDHRRFKVDIRRLFPNNILRASFFRNRVWGASWIIAATTSLNGDDWWILHLKPRPPSNPNQIEQNRPAAGGFSIQSTRVLEGNRLLYRQLSSRFFADLDYSLTGILVMHSNALWLTELACLSSLPTVGQLQLSSNLEVPCLHVNLQMEKLPESLRIHPPAGLKGKSYIQHPITLSYHGFDHQARHAIVMAHGRFHGSLRKLGLMTSKLDESVLIRQRGTAFAMRFVVPPGQTIIVDLCERIQRLNMILSLFETLKQNKTTVQTVSLSRLSFVYGPHEDLRASILIHMNGPDNISDVDPSKFGSQSGSLFSLNLDILFDRPNPHSRIRQSLATILNGTGSGTGIGSVLQLLRLTLPLLRALDRLVTKPLHSPSLNIQISVRGAKAYQIRYSALQFRFLLTTGYHRDRIIWTLKDTTKSQDRREADEPIAAKLQEKIYRGKGLGWHGLGNGAVAEVEQVGNLLSELDSCFSDVSIPVVSEHPPAGTAEQTSRKDTKDSGFGTKEGPQSSRTTLHTSNKTKNRDVIMID